MRYNNDRPSRAECDRDAHHEAVHEECVKWWRMDHEREAELLDHLDEAPHRKEWPVYEDLIAHRDAYIKKNRDETASYLAEEHMRTTNPNRYYGVCESMFV